VITTELIDTMNPPMGEERHHLQALKRSFLFLLVLCAAAFSSFAQNSQTGSPVVLDGKTVITIHWGYANYTPAVRAQGAAERLKKLASDPAVPLTLSLQHAALSTDIKCGDAIISSVFDGDAQAAGTTRDALAQQWSDSFLAAMQAYRAEHGWQQTALRVLKTLLTLAVCVYLLALIRRYTKRIALAASSVIERRIETAQSRVVKIVPERQVRAATIRLFILLRIALTLLVLAVTLHILLGIFPQTRPLATSITAGIAQTLRDFAHAFWRDLPSFLFILLLALATWYLIRLIRYFFDKVGKGSIVLEGFRPSWAGVTERLVSIAIVMLAVLIAYPYIPGSQSQAFKGISIFLGVLVSLGSTGLVANIITGVMLTYMDAFEIGDLVEIGDLTAYVKSTSLLTTRLVTRRNEIITLPNAYILSKYITNYSARGSKDGVLISTSVGIGYDSPWRQIEAMLLEAAKRTQSVLQDPAPFTLLLSLDNYAVNYEVNAYVKPGVRRYVALSELNRNVLDVFNEYGVAIMTPSYVADPPDAKVVAKSHWFSAPAKPGQTPMPQQRDYPPSRP
jgi:small-conductance mechanosensitive channel